MARPNRYEELVEEGLLIRVEGWARDGLTNEQIAENIGINVSTLYEWKKKYQELNDSLKSGKEIIDRHVENALLKRALGYEYDEEHEIITPDGTTYKTIKKQVQPDTTAQIYWLKNRKPDVWRDRKEQKIDINTSDLSEDEINELLNNET